VKLVILLPTLPVYRKDFFEKLDLDLKRDDIQMTVIHGTQFLKKTVKTDTNPKYNTFAVPTYEFKLAGYRLVWWKSIFRKIREIKPDVVIILFSPGNLTLWLVQLYCYLKKIKVGIWSCGFVRKEVTGIKRRIRGIFLNFFLHRAKFHICYGTYYKNTLLDLGIESSSVFVAQNTLNIDNILSVDTAERYERNAAPFTFLFVGALISEKNLIKAIKAIGMLVRDGYNLIFNIVGQGSIIEDLRTAVAKDNLESNIVIVGPKYGNDLVSYFINADIFILPGTGGLAINEAMAYGLPVLSTVGDGTVYDLLIEGENGFYLEDDASVENIYTKCREVLELDKSKLEKMGIRSRQIISEKATLKNMVASFESAIINGIK
jgi:glycosyltransferase involved in cell wall biosynthesis